MTTPIIYKSVPVQFAFYVHKDGRLQVTQVSKVEREIKFNSEKEARTFIKNYKKLL